MDRGAGFWLSIVLGALLLVGGGMAGCPQYNVYSSRMDGEAKQAEAVGSRQALVSQATAERDASTLRAEAASKRVEGWVFAAKKGCGDLGLPNDKDCLYRLIQDNMMFSVAHEGSPGVTIVFGGTGSTAVALPNK